MLIDERFGREAFFDAAKKNLTWIGRPVELPGSRPLRFDGTLSVGTQLNEWPREQVVKCLVHYHPDDGVALRLEQEARVAELWEATRATGHELLLELIVPRGRDAPGDSPDDTVLRAVKRFYNLGFKPEWWKLAPMAAAGWAALAALVAARDPQCRGAVILGLNAPLAELAQGFAAATQPIVKGFMVGRTLWAGPGAQWFRGTLDDEGLVTAVAGNFEQLIDAWRASRPVGSASIG